MILYTIVLYKHITCASNYMFEPFLNKETTKESQQLLDSSPIFHLLSEAAMEAREEELA